MIKHVVWQKLPRLMMCYWSIDKKECEEYIEKQPNKNIVFEIRTLQS